MSPNRRASVGAWGIFLSLLHFALLLINFHLSPVSLRLSSVRLNDLLQTYFWLLPATALLWLVAFPRSNKRRIVAYFLIPGALLAAIVGKLEVCFGSRESTWTVLRSVPVSARSSIKVYWHPGFFLEEIVAVRQEEQVAPGIIRVRTLYTRDFDTMRTPLYPEYINASLSDAHHLHCVFLPDEKQPVTVQLP